MGGQVTSEGPSWCTWQRFMLCLMFRCKLRRIERPVLAVVRGLHLSCAYGLCYQLCRRLSRTRSVRLPLLPRDWDRDSCCCTRLSVSCPLPSRHHRPPLEPCALSAT